MNKKTHKYKLLNIGIIYDELIRLGFKTRLPYKDTILFYKDTKLAVQFQDFSAIYVYPHHQQPGTSEYIPTDRYYDDYYQLVKKILRLVCKFILNLKDENK